MKEASRANDASKHYAKRRKASRTCKHAEGRRGCGSQQLLAGTEKRDTREKMQQRQAFCKHAFCAAKREHGVYSAAAQMYVSLKPAVSLGIDGQASEAMARHSGSAASTNMTSKKSELKKRVDEEGQQSRQE